MKRIIGLIGFLFLMLSAPAQVQKVSCMTSSFQGQLVDNKKQGAWVEYSSNGHVLSVSNYIDGKLNGDYVKYSPYNNQIIIEGCYKDDLKVGEWIYYNITTAFVDSIVTYSKGRIIHKI